MHSSLACVISALLVLGCTSCSSSSRSVSNQASVAPQGPIITQIVSRDQILIVRAGPAGPTYCLQSSTGDILIPTMTLDRLAMINPQLYQTVRNMQATAMDASVDMQ